MDAEGGICSLSITDAEFSLLSSFVKLRRKQEDNRVRGVRLRKSAKTEFFLDLKKRPENKQIQKETKNK